jgi:preprotein translocase SecF subunit
MGLKLIPDETHIKFTKYSPPAFVFSVVAVIASIAAFLMIGLNFGIDFKGGGVVEVGPGENRVFNEQDRTALSEAVNSLGLGDVSVTEISAQGGTVNNIVVTFEQQPADTVFGEKCVAATPENLSGEAQDKNQQIATACVKATIAEVLGEGITEERTDVVSATVSGELIRAGTLAVVLAIGAMLIYIFVRFTWQFSLGAIVALVHDVILTIGMFAVTQIEFNLPIIAALLTIVGYSMNDTVVVYDRVRENLRKFKKKPLPEVLDLSINDTLSRTIMTSVTTLLALIALFVVGGPVLRGFTAAMIWGVIIGTYSSVFIASPILRVTGVKRDWSKQAVDKT